MAIEQIKDADLKNIALARTANSYKKRNEFINSIKSHNAKHFAIAMTADTDKQLEAAIDAIGKK
jgi:hypothetical protein